MAVGYKSLFASTEETENFNDIRDSFYILMAMNQFTVRPLPHDKQEAEGLLRIALFSKDLRLIEYEGKHQTKQRNLAAKRTDLAEALRKRRRRGVVPVFVSTMWFMFSLGLSIQGAFGFIGENATAHDLALGLLMGWLPVLVLSSIIDRNPLSADDVRDKLNTLVSLVCRSLQDPVIVTEYIQTNCDGEDATGMRQRVQEIVSRIERLDSGDFFIDFAGQGRTRWHYGVAHPILSDLENVWIAEKGRDWLRNEVEARNKLVLGSANRGLFWFDNRQSWQITMAIIIVAGECLGAFILSFYTPTIGLGCRSQGYLIFGLISLGLLILEFVIWRSTSEEREEHNAHRQGSSRRGTFDAIAGDRMRQASVATKKQTMTWLEGPLHIIEGITRKWIPIIFSYTYIGDRQHRRDHLQRKVDDQFYAVRHFTARQWWNIFFFIPAELTNTAWLFKVVLSQTFGAYVNCWCQTSQYSAGGGYLDLAMVLNSELKYVLWSWATGTAISGLVLVVSLAYIVIEWCMQSHISTLDHNNAREGLQRTRAFRKYTRYARQPLQWIVLRINELWYLFSSPERRQKTLVWSEHVTYPYETRLARERGYSTNSGDVEAAEPESFPSLPLEVLYGRPRASTDTDTQGLLASPKIPDIIEPKLVGEDLGHQLRTYSDASSGRSSMDVTRKPVPQPHYEVDEYLKPRLAYTRQASDDALNEAEDLNKPEFL
jgi:hypothetical protein